MTPKPHHIVRHRFYRGDGVTISMTTYEIYKDNEPFLISSPGKKLSKELALRLCNLLNELS